MVFSNNSRTFFECVLGCKAAHLRHFKDSIFDLIRSELLVPEVTENEAESMDEDFRSMAAFLTEMRDDEPPDASDDMTTTGSSTAISPGRPRKKFLDGMSDDTLYRRFEPLDNALRKEKGVILISALILIVRERPRTGSCMARSQANR